MGKPSRFAWQPFTPNGVAAFAHAKLGRLLLLQFIIAVLIAGSVAWQLNHNWFPVLHTAIEKLPDQGGIRSAKLDWSGPNPVLLAEGRYLALTVDLNHTRALRPLAHVQVEFGRETVIVNSLLGYLEVPYPAGWIIEINRTELKPWWGAWWPAVLAIAAIGVGLGLIVIWWFLASVYFLPVQLAGFFTNRDLDRRASWKLSGAALLPGAVLMLAALLLYGFGMMDLVQLLFMNVAHLVVGWVYLFLSLLFVPPFKTADEKKNPFGRSIDKA